MSLMSASRSLPAEEMVCANLTCSGVRLPSLLSASSFARINEELSGVRSSWLMLARNSLLYWFERSSSAAFSVRTVCALDRSSFCCSRSCVCSSSCVLICSSSDCWVSSRACDSLERASLLLELFVVDAQFLLLRLELLGLPLGLLEQLLEAGAVLRRAHRDTQRLGDAGEQLLVRGVDTVKEAELHHGVDDAVDAGRRHEQRRGRAAAETGARPAGSPREHPSREGRDCLSRPGR